MAQVDDYTFGRIVIDWQEEHSDVILLAYRALCLTGAAVTDTSS